MIVEFLLDAGAGFASWFLGLLPSLPDESVQQWASALHGLAVNAAFLDTWVDWLLLVAQIVLVMGLYFAFLALKMLRAAIAHVPFFGGNG